MPPSEFARLLAVVVVGYCVVYDLIVSEGMCICLHGMGVRGALGFWSCRLDILNSCLARIFHPFAVSDESDGARKACLAFSLHPFSISTIFDGMKKLVWHLPYIHFRSRQNAMV